MSTPFRIKADVLHVVSLNPPKNSEVCSVSVFLLLQKDRFNTQIKMQNLKIGILTLKGQLFHTLTHQKELVSPIAVLKLPKAYKKVSNYGRSYS